MFPATRRTADAEVGDEVVANMEGVEHLGQYVFEMTKAKVEALKAGGGSLPPVSAARGVDGGEHGDDDDDEEEVVGLAYAGAEGEEVDME